MCVYAAEPMPALSMEMLSHASTNRRQAMLRLVATNNPLVLQTYSALSPAYPAPQLASQNSSVVLPLQLWTTPAPLGKPPVHGADAQSPGHHISPSNLPSMHGYCHAVPFSLTYPGPHCATQLDMFGTSEQLCTKRTLSRPARTADS